MLFKVQKIDSLFGLIRFRRTYGFFGSGFWEGEIDFEPIDKRIKIYVPGRRSGIYEKQREFYLNLKASYSSMVADISDVLVDMPGIYHGGHDFFASRYGEPVGQDFELDSIIFPKLSDVEQEWWLKYRYLPTKWDSTYTVYFEGWKISYGEYDD